ncbi:MAG: acyl-CoA dehydrogenase family protein [Amphiplicatus sp.]
MYDISQGMPEDISMLKDMIADFVRNEILPVEMSARRDDAVEIPRDVVAKLQPKARAAGLWCLDTPEEYGGAGLAPFPFVVAFEEASKHTYSMPDPGNGIFGFDPPNILLNANEEQREKYISRSVDEGRQWFIGITEPSGGSDPARAIQTRAVRADNGWILSGRKMYTSRADVAQHGIIFARTSEGREGISSFIIDMPAEGLSVRKVSTVRDHHTTEILLEDVHVPKANLLGEEGKGFSLAQKWLVKARLKVASQSLGVAQAAVDMAAEYATERSTFGKVLAARQAVQHLIVDSYVELNAARWLLWDAAWRHARGEDARHAASMAKLYCTEKAFTAVDRAVQVFGGIGVCKEMPVEHWFRALRVSRIIEGPSEIHKMLIARDLLGPTASDRG